jgi:hypothetical protein
MNKKILTGGEAVEIVATTKAKDGKTADECITEKLVSKIIDEGKRPTPEAKNELMAHAGIAPFEPRILSEFRVRRPRK